MTDSRIRMALIGAGFIGRSHGLAIRAVNAVFQDVPLRASAHVLCDLDLARAERTARAMGFEHVTDDWRKAVDMADAVIIAVPSRQHGDIARHAIRTGKPFLCEKPVGLSSVEAEDLAHAAHAAGIPHAVGFTYLRAPMVAHARELVRSGRLGRILHFSGRHFEDYLSSRDAPFSWRLDASLAGRCGALGDLGCHILSVARAIIGPVESVSGMATTIHGERLDTSAGHRRSVENEDHAAAILRFAGGVPGMVETSRVATGRKMDISFEVTGELGSVHFSGENYNALSVYMAGDETGLSGFRRVLVNNAHPDYAAFLPAPAHGLGFNDLKTIELAHFLRAIHAGHALDPDLFEAARISRLCEAILESSQSGRRLDEPEVVDARNLANRKAST